MQNIKKKKKWPPLITNLMGLFSTRSNLQSSYPQPTAPLTEEPVTTSYDLGGSDEDPLPTMRRAIMPKKMEPKYNGTLFRSTTSRPIIYDPIIYQDFTYNNAPIKDIPTIEESPWQFRLRRISGLIKRYSLIKIRDMHRLANLLYFPTIDILIGGLIWLWREQSNANLENACAEYLFSLIFWIVANSSQFETCFNFLEEFQSRNLLNLFTSTLEHGEWLISSALLCLLEAVASTTICGLLAYAVFGTNILVLGWLLPLITVLFIASGWIMAVITSGLFLIFGQRATFLIWAVPYLILPLSAPFYPVSALPIWAQYIALSLPTTYLFESVRLIAFAQTIPTLHLIISCTLTGIYSVLAILFFNFTFKKSKENGLARLEQE